MRYVRIGYYRTRTRTQALDLCLFWMIKSPHWSNGRRDFLWKWWKREAQRAGGLLVVALSTRGRGLGSCGRSHAYTLILSLNRHRRSHIDLDQCPGWKAYTEFARC
jgi:hypothetical protein